MPFRTCAYFWSAYCTRHSSLRFLYLVRARARATGLGLGPTRRGGSCTAIVPLLYRYCTAIVPLLYRYCTAIVPLLYREALATVPIAMKGTKTLGRVGAGVNGMGGVRLERWLGSGLGLGLG
jgi:hypothetical protein